MRDLEDMLRLETEIPVACTTTSDVGHSNC